MARIELRNISKSFGATAVLKDIDPEIEDGPFLVLVGPSGCGKSTLLRVLALAAQPTDWLGVNYYTRGVMKDDPAAWPVGAALCASRTQPIARPAGRFTSRA